MLPSEGEFSRITFGALHGVVISLFHFELHYTYTYLFVSALYIMLVGAVRTPTKALEILLLYNAFHVLA